MKKLVLLSYVLLKKNSFGDQHNTVLDYVNHNECALALDILCETVIENKITIDRKQLFEIKELAKIYSFGSIKISVNSFRLLELLLNN